MSGRHSRRGGETNLVARLEKDSPFRADDDSYLKIVKFTRHRQRYIQHQHHELPPRHSIDT